MTDEFVSLKVMIVSETAADRELIRRGVAGASIPVMISEIVAVGGEPAALKSLASDTFDLVLFDDRMPASDKQVLLAAIRGEASQPLVVVIGAAAGLEVDGTLAKPLEQQRVSELIDHILPPLSGKVKLYTKPFPIFDEYGVCLLYTSPSPRD